MKYSLGSMMERSAVVAVAAPFVDARLDDDGLTITVTAPMETGRFESPVTVSFPNRNLPHVDILVSGIVAASPRGNAG